MKKVVLFIIFTLVLASPSFASEQFGSAIIEYDQFKNRVTVSIVRKQMINATTAIFIHCDRNFDMTKYETYKKAKDSYNTEPAMLTFMVISATEFYHFAKNFDYIVENAPGKSNSLVRLSSDYDRSRGLFSTAAFCVIGKGSEIYNAIKNKIPPLMRINFSNKPPFTFTFVDSTLDALDDVLKFDIVHETEKRLNLTRSADVN